MSHDRIRIWGVLGIILILFSIAFAALPLLPNSSLDVIRITVRQRALEERIVKDVLTLACQPTSKVQAINELQTTLPTWEQVQVGLLNGDASLGISPNPPEDINLLLLQAQSDYMSIDTAIHQILAHPSTVDQLQIAIVLQHDSGYYTTMAHVDMLLEAHVQFVAKLYFGFGVAISIGLLLIWMQFFRKMIRIDKEHQERKKEKNEVI